MYSHAQLCYQESHRGLYIRGISQTFLLLLCQGLLSTNRPKVSGEKKIEVSQVPLMLMLSIIDRRNGSSGSSSGSNISDSDYN